MSNEFNIIKIKSNHFNLKDIVYKKTPNFDTENNLKLKSNFVDFEKTREKIKEYVEIIKVNNKNFLEKSILSCNFDRDHYTDITDCYEEKDYSYQIINKMPHVDDNPKKLEPNIIASLISYKKEVIYDNVILFKNYLPHDSYNAENMDVDVDDIIYLLMNNIYHTGVYIGKNNKIEQIYFNNNMDLVNLNNKFLLEKEKQIMKNSNYGYKDLEYVKFKLRLIFNSNIDNEINEPLSRLARSIIKGDGIIISPFNENSYYDLTKEDVIDLLKIYKNLDFKIEDAYDLENKEGLKIEINKYRLLNNRLKNLV